MKTLALLIAPSTLVLLLATAALAGPEGAVQGPSAEAWSLTPFLGVWQALEEDGSESDSMIEIARDYVSVVRGDKLDQGVRKVFETAGGQPTEADTQKMTEVDTDNTAWLTELVAEVGWIDSQRFSDEAAEVAFLIVQHSGDLRLMAAALPAIEADVEASGANGGRYALLFDRFRMWRAERQRYGSQLGFGADGMFLYPLEDPASVDERRAEVGLEPLAAYLERFRERNGDKPVEIREDF